MSRCTKCTGKESKMNSIFSVSHWVNEKSYNEMARTMEKQLGEERKEEMN